MAATAVITRVAETLAEYSDLSIHYDPSPVESMAAGKPVIGVAEGGLLETVVPDQTGILLEPPPTADAIMAAVHDLTPRRALEMRSACETRSSLFTREIFLEKMRGQIFTLT